MQTYIALLRGINVGGNNIIKMADLKAEFENLKFQNVKTYIQSGNVIFQSNIESKKELETTIEKALSKKFSYNATVLIRSFNEIQTVIECFPKLFDNPEWKHNVIFLGEEIDTKKILDEFNPKPDLEEVTYIKGTLFWSAKLDTITKSDMLKLSTRKQYQKMTVRNQNTTRKILELMRNL